MALRAQGTATQSIVETLVLLPLVMPPVSTGLILLKIFGRRSPFGQWLYERGIEFVFNWKGVLIAMAVMSFPLLVRSVRTSFAEVNPRSNRSPQRLVRRRCEFSSSSRCRSPTKGSSPARSWRFRAPSASSARRFCWPEIFRAKHKLCRWRSIITSNWAKTRRRILCWV